MCDCAQSPMHAFVAAIPSSLSYLVVMLLKQILIFVPCSSFIGIGGGTLFGAGTEAHSQRLPTDQ